MLFKLEEVGKFVGGFDLAGWKRPDGKIISVLRSDQLLDEWPETVEFQDATYTLEKVVSGTIRDDGCVYQNALYA